MPPHTSNRVTGWLSNTLQNITKQLEPYMPLPPPAPPLPPAQAAIINLRNSGAFKFLGFLFDSFIGATGSFSINKIVDFFIPNGTLHMNSSVPVAVLNISNGTMVSFGIPHGLVAGLDTWTAFNLLNTVGGEGIASSLTLQNLTIDLDLAFNVTFAQQQQHEEGEEEGLAFNAGFPPDMPPIIQRGYIQLGFNHTSLKQETILPFDKNRWDNLSAGQPINPGCIFTAMNDPNMTFLDLNSTIAVFALAFPDGNLDEDFSGAVDALLLLVTSTLQPIVPTVLRGWASECHIDLFRCF